jgi:hypothetical protein
MVIFLRIAYDENLDADWIWHLVWKLKELLDDLLRGIGRYFGYKLWVLFALERFFIMKYVGNLGTDIGGLLDALIVEVGNC